MTNEAGSGMKAEASTAEWIYGYSAAEAQGRPISILVPPTRRDEVPAILERIKHGQRISHYETVRVRKDGQRIDVSLTVSPIKDAADQIIGASAIARDITEKKRAEEEVRTMTQQLWQATKLASVGELAASIAHELNNPLATVSLRVESVLARTTAEDPRRKALEIIEQEIKRMGELVDNLLQFSRRGDGQISTVDIRQELTKAVELIHRHLRKRLITVVREFAADTPTIYADRQKLRQVFLNLLTNASDVMPQGGMLFIDEVAEMAPALQAKFLRVLEDRHFRRVGGIKEHQADVRVLAATNKPLEKEQKAGRFREDLFYRLNVVSIELTPLRERRQDIPALVEHFLSTRQLGKVRCKVHSDAMQALLNYDWPGNVRELANVLERAQILAEDNLITLDDLPEAMHAVPDIAASVGPLNLSELERKTIAMALQQAKGNKVYAAKLLGITRRALYRLITKYGLEALGAVGEARSK